MGRYQRGSRVSFITCITVTDHTLGTTSTLHGTLIMPSLLHWGSRQKAQTPTQNDMCEVCTGSMPDKASESTYHHMHFSNAARSRNSSSLGALDTRTAVGAAQNRPKALARPPAHFAAAAPQASQPLPTFAPTPMGGELSVSDFSET
jgi:hypothetical protein